jgi:predicted nucleic acid-binding Zn ribbon protein
MPIYVYQTIPQKPDEKPRYVEFKQGMTDEPFTTHPETGEPIRRVVLGKFGVLTSREPSGNSGPCCEPGSGCCSG